MLWSVVKHSTVDSKTVNGQSACLLEKHVSMKLNFVNCLLFYTLLLIVHSFNVDLRPRNYHGLHHGYGSVDRKILRCTKLPCLWLEIF